LPVGIHAIRLACDSEVAITLICAIDSVSSIASVFDCFVEYHCAGFRSGFLDLLRRTTLDRFACPGIRKRRICLTFDAEVILPSRLAIKGIAQIALVHDLHFVVGFLLSRIERLS
jgi:hypothetical protein